jgi:hypothetical protein
VAGHGEPGYHGQNLGATTGKVLTTKRGHIGYVFGVPFSHDGHLASTSRYRDKGEVKIWETEQWDHKPNAA